MKRCPECRRDYYDDTLLYCLDDGNALLEGPATAGSDEPATAILSESPALAGGQLPSESPTRAFNHTTDQTAILRTGAEAEPPGGLGDSSERQSLSAQRAKQIACRDWDSCNPAHLLDFLAIATSSRQNRRRSIQSLFFLSRTEAETRTPTIFRTGWPIR